MKIIEDKQEMYAGWKAKNDDHYGKACFDFAEQWAELIVAQADTKPEADTCQSPP